MARARLIGTWHVLDRLGGGGNGDVYRCRGADGTEAAIKVLKRGRDVRRDRISRFRNEVNFLITRGTCPGVLPLLDSALPDDPGQPSWYVMPLAVPLLTALGGTPELSGVVSAIEQIAQTLARLAADGISHRDVKPDNLFRLHDEWVIGDFGLVRYPEQESVTRHGRPLGPYYFMAPEVRRDADTANAELADVYSLAKTLWAVAAARPDPPPGELRTDRAELRLSSYVDDVKARYLEPLLERSTSHEPTARLTMHELAEELSWWSESSGVLIRPDLSAYAEDVQRLREANRAARQESEEDRLARVWNEAWIHFQSSLSQLLTAAMTEAGLQSIGPGPRPIEGWPPNEEYGGTASLPCWGIDTIASPWLAAIIGANHRAVPVQDLNDLAVTFVLALMTEDSQHNYLQEFERFRSGSLRLDRIIEQWGAKITDILPQVIADFLTACRDTGVPR